LITNQKQSNTGAPVIGGVGARSRNIRSRISRNVNQVIVQTPNLPQLVGFAVNTGIVLYFDKSVRTITYEYEITDNAGNQVSNANIKYLNNIFYTVITGLTNGTAYTVRVRGYNIYQEKSEWSAPLVITPQLNTTQFTTTGSASINIPLGIPVNYLVVAGGGGGGGTYDTGESGGGGGGMVLTGSFISQQTSYNIVVGAGGAAGRGIVNGSSRTEESGGDGGNSTIVGIANALGGKGGIRSRGGLYQIGGAAANQSVGLAAEGGGGGGSASGSNSGGGGGSSGNGGNGANSGGAGTAVSIGNITGTYGVGGSGVNNGQITNPVNGASNTGNGGSGSSTGSFSVKNGGVGGSGLVVFAY
jgi:hypothetical protein